MVRCPYDTSHLVPASGRAAHIRYCPRKRNGATTRRYQRLELPLEEDWEPEIVPGKAGYVPPANLDYPVFREVQTMTPKQRRDYYRDLLTQHKLGERPTLNTKTPATLQARVSLTAPANMPAPSLPAASNPPAPAKLLVTAKLPTSANQSVLNFTETQKPSVPGNSPAPANLPKPADMPAPNVSSPAKIQPRVSLLASANMSAPKIPEPEKPPALENLPKPASVPAPNLPEPTKIPITAKVLAPEKLLVSENMPALRIPQPGNLPATANPPAPQNLPKPANLPKPVNLQLAPDFPTPTNLPASTNLLAAEKPPAKKLPASANMPVLSIPEYRNGSASTNHTAHDNLLLPAKLQAHVTLVAPANMPALNFPAHANPPAPMNQPVPKEPPRVNLLAPANLVELANLPINANFPAPNFSVSTYLPATANLLAPASVTEPARILVAPSNLSEPSGNGSVKELAPLASHLDVACPQEQQCEPSDFDTFYDPYTNEASYQAAGRGARIPRKSVHGWLVQHDEDGNVCYQLGRGRPLF
ncbi:hypothetical protein HPB49_017421 [Dermacentor silvarum]|uniref:Uncharacterized protein n=1 Tax=Dermacentor silvarum TaxID=543639 RepID=A0ACB8E253_DERSI|nr:hypothetical protein HPB49_017421 [Dermacentor silvarum]